MINGLNGFNYSKNLSMFPKEKLPIYPITGFNGPDIIYGGQSSVDREIGEFKKIIAQSNNKEAEATSIVTSYAKDILAKVKLNLPFASFWGIEDGWV